MSSLPIPLLPSSSLISIVKVVSIMNEKGQRADQKLVARQ